MKFVSKNDFLLCLQLFIERIFDHEYEEKIQLDEECNHHMPLPPLPPTLYQITEWQAYCSLHDMNVNDSASW